MRGFFKPESKDGSPNQSIHCDKNDLESEIWSGAYDVRITTWSSNPSGEVPLRSYLLGDSEDAQQDTKRLEHELS